MKQFPFFRRVVLPVIAVLLSVFSIFTSYALPIHADYSAADTSTEVETRSPASNKAGKASINPTAATPNPPDAVSRNAEIQTIAFYSADEAENIVTEIQAEKSYNLEISIYDNKITKAEVEAATKADTPFVKINADTFLGSSPVISRIAESGSATPSTACSYTVRFNNITYKGAAKILRLSIDYGMDHTVRQLSYNLEDYVFTSSSSSENHGNNNNNDDDDKSSSRPDIAPPTPTLIVSEYDYGGGSVAASGKFSLKMRFTNTSKKLPIDNIVVKVVVPEALTLSSSSNTFYIEKMARESSVERTLDLAVKPNAEPISHAIKLSFTYEAVIDEVRKQLTSEQEISIPVKQLDRFSLSPIEVPTEIYVGEDSSIEISFVNKGKTPVYNVSTEITGNLAQPGQRQFVGNIEAGKEDTATFILSATEGGEITGDIIISYEDANMNETELREPFRTTAISYSPPPDADMNAMGSMEQKPAQTSWYQQVPTSGWVVCGVLTLALLAYSIYIMQMRSKVQCLPEDDNEDL